MVIWRFSPQGSGRDNCEATPRSSVCTELEKTEPKIGDEKGGTWHALQGPRKTSTHSAIAEAGLGVRPLNRWVEPSAENSLGTVFIVEILNYENPLHYQVIYIKVSTWTIVENVMESALESLINYLVKTLINFFFNN